MKTRKLIIGISIFTFLLLTTSSSFGQSAAKDKGSTPADLRDSNRTQRQIYAKKQKLMKQQELSRKIREEAFNRQMQNLERNQDSLRIQILKFKEEEKALKRQEEKQLEEEKNQLKQADIEGLQLLAQQKQKQQATLQKELERNYEERFSREITLESDSEVKEIPFKLEEKVAILFWNISSELSSGDLLIELYDPNGIKQAQFSLKTKSVGKNGKSENVNGLINKTIKAPLLGGWKAKIIPRNASGTVRLRVAIAFNEITGN